MRGGCTRGAAGRRGEGRREFRGRGGAGGGGGGGGRSQARVDAVAVGSGARRTPSIAPQPPLRPHPLGLRAARPSPAALPGRPLFRTGFGDFSISTRHMRQLPATDKRSWKQNRGTLMPTDSIACRMLDPFSIWTLCPSIVTSIICAPSFGTSAEPLPLWMGSVDGRTASPSSPIAATARVAVFSERDDSPRAARCNAA